MGEYLVDFVVKTVSDIGEKGRPLMFQRDGAFFVVSGNAMGQICYGLETDPNARLPWDKDSLMPEIAKSEEVLDRVLEGKNAHDGMYEFFKNFMFEGASRAFTLEDMTKLSHERDDINQDLGIPMFRYVRKDEKVPNDLGLMHARLLQEDTYLELLRHKEDAIIGAIEAIGSVSDVEDPNKLYANLPYCTILTPRMMASLPRYGTLIGYAFDQHPQTWLTTTPFENNRDTNSILNYLQGFKIFEVNPFNVFLNINGASLDSAQELDQWMNMLSRDREIIRQNIGRGLDSIERLNKVHNKLFESEIV